MPLNRHSLLSYSVQAAVATFGGECSSTAGAERFTLLHGRMENLFCDMVVKDLLFYQKCLEWKG